MSNNIRRYLARRGSPDFIILGGLPGLVKRWEETTRSVSKKYPLGMDDYLNDLDVRQLIAETLPLASLEERKKLRARVVQADTLFKNHSRAARYCLWGARVARRHGWTSRKNWWYYRLPAAPGKLLRDESAGPRA
jgi:hypothetical protein